MTHLCAHLYICISIYMQTKRQESTVNMIKNGCRRWKDGCLANSLGWWWGDFYLSREYDERDEFVTVCRTVHLRFMSSVLESL